MGKSKRVLANKGAIYNCYVNGCEAVFTNAKRLKAHQQIHNNKHEFECRDCKNRFKTEVILSKHRRKKSLHRFGCPFKCCDTFRNFGNLKIHLRNAHSLSTDDVSNYIFINLLLSLP